MNTDQFAKRILGPIVLFLAFLAAAVVIDRCAGPYVPYGHGPSDYEDGLPRR